MSPRGQADAITEYSAGTERIIAWLRIGALLLFGLGETLPHPNHAVVAYFTTLALYSAWSAAVLVWVYRHDADQRVGSALTVVDVAAITLLVIFSGGPFSYARNAYFLIPVSVAFRFQPRLTAVASVVTVGAYSVQAVLHPASDLADAKRLVPLHAGYLALVGLACVGLSTVLARRTGRIAALLESRERLLADALSAEDRERQMLAESLHDHAIQDLLAARHEIELARAAAPGAAEPLARASEQLLVGVRHLREAVYELHPYVLGEVGLPAALRTLAHNAAERGGLHLELDIDETDAPAHATLTYGLARELISNVVRHARAHTLRVGLHPDNGSRHGLRLSVGDDGVGLDEALLAARLAEGHIGIASQRVRIESAGGELRIDASPGHGTLVEAMLPA